MKHYMELSAAKQFDATGNYRIYHTIKYIRMYVCDEYIKDVDVNIKTKF